MSTKKEIVRYDHGVEPARHAKDDLEEYKIDTRYKQMIPIKRYKHHTLFYKPSLNGNGYHECFLNREIERAKRVPG